MKPCLFTLMMKKTYTAKEDSAISNWFSAKGNNATWFRNNDAALKSITTHVQREGNSQIPQNYNSVK